MYTQLQLFPVNKAPLPLLRVVEVNAQPLRVLVACEESQAVCIELRNRGFNAYSCDILPCSGGHPEWHIQKDVTELLTEFWDLVIAFPPCTDLAVSGAAWFEQKRKDGRQQKSIDFFMLFANYDGKIAIENPVGIMSRIYRKPNQIIEPYYFGDAANKKTCIWLKGLPKLKHNPDNYSKGSEYIESPSGRRYPDWCWKTGGGSGHVRSKTYPGIAKAMAEQWGDYLLRTENILSECLDIK